jgi:hypothetical protein
MFELMVFLSENGFQTFIVSGGTLEFRRAFTERIYGIPPEPAVGTTFAAQFRMREGGQRALLCQPKIKFIDGGPGKPLESISSNEGASSKQVMDCYTRRLAVVAPRFSGKRSG